MKASKPLLINGKPLGNGAMPAIITPLVGKTRAGILEEVAAIVPKKPDLLEWRIDFFEAIGDRRAVIDTALAIRKAAAIPVLLTRRNASEGGQALTIDEAAVIAMYAGMLGPVGSLDSQSPAAIGQAVALNVSAPLMFAAALAQRHAGELRILHISSGAARFAYAGWSIYGATLTEIGRASLGKSVSMV